MPDVYLNMQALDEVLSGLSSAITEFDEASEVSSGLQDAVGRPDERGSLRSRVDDFESDWNNTRNELSSSLDEIRTHLQDVIDGWRDWDSEAAAAMQSNGPDNDPAAHEPA
ncbi:hypothetical protein ASE14_11505 [Agromyces sp. Root81]|uniref:hypothetical protein n=1 Tax=Agromyces sp. Root81 TaxID=1736601 RepID=UPI0006FF4482|nr:hypothetical protein [Agromyces sp. Root81]KRC61484.1 hypothetical protein ASE14_11505 [Agromyces sp. Root81]